MSDKQVAGNGKDGTAGPVPLPTNTKKRHRLLRTLLVLFFSGLIAIQFLQPDKNNNNILSPNGISTIITIPDTVQALLKASCYDCHSNNTNYPWYANIQPGGWWIASHVKDGKRHLNFSEFANIVARNGKTVRQRQDHVLEEIKETVESGEMPLGSYLWLHTEAKFSQEQKKLITNWVDSARKELNNLPGENKQ